MCHIGTKTLDGLRRQTRLHRSCDGTLTAGDTALNVPDVPVGRHRLIFDFASPFPHNAPVFRSHLRGERLRDVYQFHGLSTSQTRAAKIKVAARNIRGNLLVQLGSYGLAATP